MARVRDSAAHWVGGLVAVGLAGWLATQGPMAWNWLDRQVPVERVEVTGDLDPDRARELGRWLASRIEGGLLTVDLDALRRAAVERARIRQAWLRRSGLDAVRIRVERHRARARWRPGSERQWRLVNERGAVFRPQLRPEEEELPALVGPRERLAELHRRLEELDRRLGADLDPTRVAVGQRGSWSAQVNERVRVRFGTDHWSQRLERLLQVQSGWDLLERRVERIDLRHPAGMAVALAADSGQEGEGARPMEAGGPPPTTRR